MSGSEFHVHGAHEHEIEHASDSRGSQMHQHHRWAQATTSLRYRLLWPLSPY